MGRVLLLSVLIFLCNSTCLAFDGNRQGFIVGFGAGLCLDSFDQSLSGVGEASDNKNGLVTDFKIGYAPNHRFEIYFTNKTSWFSITNALGDEAMIADGLSAIGASYFFSPVYYEGEWERSFFFSAGVGQSFWETPFESEKTDMRGLGYFIGFGYEFIKHYRIESNLLMNTSSLNEGELTVETNSMVLIVTLSALAF